MAYRYFSDVEKKVTLTVRGGQEYDLSSIFMEFSIYENIFNHSLSGYVQLLDSTDLLNQLNLFGFEKINISMKTPEKEGVSNYEFIVYKISDMGMMNDRSCMYKMYFTTEEAIKNTNIRVSSHFEGNISTIAPKVFELLESDKTLTVDETAYIHDVITPNLTPFKILNRLSMVAVNPNTANASFVFYETLDGYMFRSIENLVSVEDVVMEYKRNHVKALDINDENFHDASYKSFKKFASGDRFDHIKSINEGVYSNRYIQHDIMSKKCTTYDFNRDAATTLEPNSFIPSEFSSNANEYVGVFTSHLKRTPISSEIKSPHSRRSIISGLKQNINRIEVSGNSTLRVGDVINYEHPSFSPASDEGNADKYLSGKRLVIANRHIVSNVGYTQILELSKDSLKEALS